MSTYSAMNEFVSTLKKEQQERGMTLRQFAAMLGMHHSNLQRIFRGDENLTVNRIETICEKMNLRMKVKFEPTAKKVSA